ncbi:MULTISPECIES: YbaK/EbsC family protein [Desulfosediminicola]|uniref:YbaK/EbsC family protein n=1 Tax=Desulfosediminicola TaxID=2886823 RepID=UPI0010AD0288|nr:YbaK/EbsC family protein [Desulfosediminicola ganghwensis]
MSNIPDKVRAFLENHNLAALEFEPGSTPTAEMAAQRIGVPVGQIAKSILFKGKDNTFRLVVAAGDKKINSGALKRATGAKHRMATADETNDVTGFLPGGVCPFGLAEAELEILLDISLDKYETVYPAAGTNATGVPLSPDYLQQITGGVKVEVT